MASFVSGCLRRIALKSFALAPVRNYAVKSTSSSALMGLGKGKKKTLTGKLGPASEKIVLPVETDPERLVNYVCGSNVLTTGEDIKLKPDSEYPAWIWDVRVGPPPPLKDLDPTTKEYWLRVRKMGKERSRRLKSLKKF